MSDEGQDAIATMILSELEDEMKWEQSFAESHDLLADLAAEAMAEYKQGMLIISPQMNADKHRWVIF